MNEDILLEMLTAVITIPVAIFLGLRILRYGYRGMVHVVYYLSLKKENRERAKRGIEPLPYDLRFNDYKYDPDKEEEENELYRGR